MNDEDKKIVMVAMNFIQSILNFGEPTVDSISELYKIARGDKEVILGHLKAINSITGEAINILENNSKKEDEKQ